MNPYSFPAIAAFVINVSIAFVVFFGNPKSAVNRWLSAFVLSFAIWNVSEIFILASGSQQGATFAAHILYRVIFILPAIYVISAFHFPRSVSKLTQSALFHIGVLLLPAIFLVSSFPNFHIELTPLSGSGIVYCYRIMVRPDFQSISLLTTFFAYLLWGSLVMTRKLAVLRSTTQKRRGQLFLLGGLIFLVLSLLLFAVEQFTRETVYFYTASTLLSSVISGFFAVAVLRGQLFKSPRAMRSSVAYSIASSIVLAIYFLSVQAVTEGLLHYLDVSSYAANAIFVLILVLLLRPLELRIHHSLDNLLGRDLNRYRHNMVTFSHELSHYVSTDEFFHRLESFLSRQFSIQSVLILLKDESPSKELSRQQFSEWPQRDGSVHVGEDCYLIQHLRRVQGPVEFYDIDRRNIDPALHSFLEIRGVRLIVPLFSADELLGILAISVGRSGQELTTDMIEALTIMANEVATAYERNLTIERIRRKEQQESRVQHLASLGQLTAGVAHEIRNPLSVISASAQTLLKKQLTMEEEKELKQFIVDEADRLNTILTDFLSLSKLRPPKYEIVSLAEILQRVQTAILTSKPEMEIRFPEGNTDTEFLTDRDLLIQLLLNLGLNAVDAIRERCKSDRGFSCSKGIVAFSTRIQGERLNFSVSDNGIGIPEEKLGRIFDPFYTTKDSGTGLGLSISHNIAETLGGDIQITSRKGETVFTFTCEIRKERA